ncbi:MAG: hypothetical protein ABI833_22035 [Acidobacteriota bacterium]
MRAILWIAAGVVFGSIACLCLLLWPQRLPPYISQPPFKPEVTGTGVRLVCSGGVVAERLGQFDDELFAWLMFDYFRSRKALANKQLTLISGELSGHPLYSIYVILPADIEKAIWTLVGLKGSVLKSEVDWMCVTPATIEDWQKETNHFIDAYRGPAKRVIERMKPVNLQRYLRRFIRFKSITDPRIRNQVEPIPSPLTGSEANRLAADIIAVARFYDLPIDIFLGIGAMENNYMDVAGDLRNTIWKRAPQTGDIILRRKAGRVLVRNDSQGVWQITRESLRYAHSLFLADTRTYASLPERLRPPKILQVDHVTPDVLTTYSGLLRNLIDRFHGDITHAVGAYNGGPGAPNSDYAAGVGMVASYARKVLERSAAIQGLSLADSHQAHTMSSCLSPKVFREINNPCGCRRYFSETRLCPSCQLPANA